MKIPLTISLTGCLIVLTVSGCREESNLIAEVEQDAKPKKTQSSGLKKDPFAEFRTEQILDDALDQPAFLETNYEPLSNWLDERFEVKFRAMTPSLMFDQVPLNDIHYQLSNIPDNAPPFEYESVNTSRRELLRKIANYWDLEMNFITSEDGNPSAVSVSGR